MRPDIINFDDQASEAILAAAEELDIDSDSEIEQVMTVLQAIALSINTLDIPAKDRKKAIHRLEEIADELQEERPNKRVICRSVEETAEVLKRASVTVTQIKPLMPNVNKVSAWLGKTTAQLGWLF